MDQDVDERSSQTPVAIIGMAFILVVLSIQHTHALYKLERLPKR